jgi:hypothetical protein
MDEFAEKFEFVKMYYHCKLCPGQFGWFQENQMLKLFFGKYEKK